MSVRMTIAYGRCNEFASAQSAGDELAVRVHIVEVVEDP